MGAVPYFDDIVADILNSIFDKVTFVESEADAVFEKNFTDSFEVNEDRVKVSIEENNVINNGKAAGNKLGFIEVNSVCLSE